jgi:asparagine synthetase B (glutamine-hydrolysing)
MSDIINQKPICLYSHNYNSERLHGFKINEYLFSTNEILSYNGKYICFIGVISNIEALRRRFNIYDSDQRIVILKIYEQYALKTSNYLEGNYAVVIVDKHDVCFFRDRNSIENIYYCRNTQDTSFIISSRIKDIKEFVPLDLNPDVLPKYFLLSTISISDTFFKNIFSLKRCEIMKLNLPTGKWESLYYDDYANKPIEHLNNNSIEDSIETIIGNYIQEVKNSYPDYDLVNSFPEA